MSVASGRYIGENGEVYNLVDLLGAGAVPVEGLVKNIDEYSPRSGRLIGEDGKVYNVVDLIAAKQAGIDNAIDEAVAPLTSQLAEIANNSGKVWNDFAEYYGTYGMWSAVAVLSGTRAASAGTSKHPGVVAYSSHASNANSGYRYSTDINAILIGGGEKSTVVFKTASTLARVTRRFGFLDTTSSGAPTDGVYARIVDGTLVGATANNTNLVTTGTDYSLAQDTWYRFVIQINADATRVDFALYADDSATVLWTDYIASNIPKTAGRETGHGDICTLASPSGATIIGYIDYIDAILPNARGLV